MSPILSIIIPTKNRVQYLKDCLISSLLIQESNIEIIVHDNSDDPNQVKELVDELNDKRIKYYYTDQKLSQTENSELALSYASGEYITFIGDDDSVCTSITRLAYNMKKYNIESCTYSIPKYYWEDLRNNVKNLCTLEYSKNSGKIHKKNSKKILYRSLKHGMYDITDLARVYHGIVSRKLLYFIKDKCKSFFPGPSPDMANATVVSLYSNNHFHVDIPMIVSGYGKNSAGGMGRRNLHKGSLKGNFQLRDDVEQNWNPKIPKLWMASTIYPQSASTALISCGEDKLLNKMNYGAIYFETIWHDSDSKSVVKNIKKRFKDYVGYYLHFFNRALKKIFYKKEKVYSSYDNISLVEATEVINNYANKFDIDKIFDSYHKKER